MLLKTLRAAPLLAALWLGCGGPKPTPADGGPCVKHQAGSAQAPISAQAVALDAAGNLVVLSAGDPIALTVPGQGGYVLYAGVRATNLQACGATVTAQLIDPASGNSLSGLDQRQGDFVQASDGYFLPPRDEYRFELANIPACPDPLHIGVQGRHATLKLDLTDTEGKSTSLQLDVVPTCAPDSTLGACRCICGPAPDKC